ncbi:MAG: CoA transferase [Chloroflexi bacterium]|nr:CoA transferase [Chloroflexota bacterium]
MSTEVSNGHSPLDRITVIELAGPPGAWAGGLLAEFGARVIKVSRAGAAPVRWGTTGMRPLTSPEERERYAAFNPFDRNKESITLDLKKAQARQILCRLVERADIVTEGYRPGVAGRLGADYETLRRINPRIIYCAITGYGQGGPYRDMVGHDINYSAMAGLLDLTGPPGSRPSTCGIPVGDWMGGMSQAVIGILLALVARHTTGDGQFIDVALTDGIVSTMKGHIASYLETGAAPKKGETVSHGGAPYNDVYETKDGKFVAIGCWEPHLYENLCRALGLEDLLPLQHAAGEDRERVKRALTRAFLARTRDEWFEFLRDRDVAVAPVKSLPEVLEDPQVRHREMVVELEHDRLGKVKQAGIGIKLSRTPGRIRRLAPPDGRDTEKLLRELGYSPGDIQHFQKDGVVDRYEGDR